MPTTIYPLGVMQTFRLRWDATVGGVDGLQQKNNSNRHWQQSTRTKERPTSKC